MIILIDAYNLLKTVLHSQFIQKYERTRFLNLFEKYASMRGHEVIVVFDGTSDVYEVVHSYTLITIYYSGYKQTADDLIKKKLQELKGFDVLLVTCDRDIRKFGQQCGIESIGSQEFYRIVQNIMEQKDEQEHFVAQSVHKTSIDTNKELDALMEMGSRQLLTKESDKAIKVSQEFLKKYDSKKDKKLLKKIVKI